MDALYCAHLYSPVFTCIHLCSLVLHCEIAMNNNNSTTTLKPIQASQLSQPLIGILNKDYSAQTISPIQETTYFNDININQTDTQSITLISTTRQLQNLSTINNSSVQQLAPIINKRRRHNDTQQTNKSPPDRPSHQPLDDSKRAITFSLIRDDFIINSDSDSDIQCISSCSFSSSSSNIRHDNKQNTQHKTTAYINSFIKETSGIESDSDIQIIDYHVKEQQSINHIESDDDESDDDKSDEIEITSHITARVGMIYIFHDIISFTCNTIPYILSIPLPYGPLLPIFYSSIHQISFLYFSSTRPFSETKSSKTRIIPT